MTFAALQGLTHALLHLAADHSLAVPMRQEVEAVMAEENGNLGSRTAVSKLKTIDSFLRESQRLNGVNASKLCSSLKHRPHTELRTASAWRKTLKPVTFSSGITVPAGVLLSASAAATHLDEELFDNPNVFDPWRFMGSSGDARSFVSLSPDYIVFGQGKHAWYVFVSICLD